MQHTKKPNVQREKRHRKRNRRGGGLNGSNRSNTNKEHYWREKPKARGAIRALGLGRIGRSRVHEDNKVVRGMIHGVRHLVEVKDQ
jgi:ribosomal protein L30